MLVQGKLLFFGEDLSDAYEIRKAVFVDEMGISSEVEFDDRDNTAIHAVIYEETVLQPDQKKAGMISGNKKAVATGRMVFDGISCRIDHIAVLEKYRDKQYDDLAVRMLLNKAFLSGINEVIAHAPTSMVEVLNEIGFHSIGEKITEHGKAFCNMIIRSSDFTTACNKNRKI